MRIALGTDHAGFALKERIKHLLEEQGHEIEDFGCYSSVQCDYPDHVMPAAQAVANGRCGRGIVLGGSGNGEAIAANRFRGVRCALCWNMETARLAREHNDANVMALGARQVGVPLALDMVRVWMSAAFTGGRHERRIRKIDEYALHHDPVPESGV
jgi:ribose 5-phosphate isomerase B